MIEAKEKPKYYQLRWNLSNIFIKIAQKIYPNNPDVKAFWLQQMQDQFISGQSIIRIDPWDGIVLQTEIPIEIISK